VVELRYTYGGSGGDLRVPSFKDDETAVQQVYLAAYLPEEQQLLGYTGPWTPENRDAWPPDDSPRGNDEHLLTQLRQDVAGCDTLGRDFRTDGNLYVFSSLRPTKDDSLRLVSMNRSGLNVLIFLLVAIVGVLLTARPVGDRLWYLAAMVVAIVLIAVLMPTLHKAIFNTTLWSAIGLLLIVWLVRFLAWALPGLMQWLATRPVRTAAAASAVAAAAATSPPAAEAGSPFRPGGPNTGTVVITPEGTSSTATPPLPSPNDAPKSTEGEKHNG
jgi:hypothetical protein